MRSGRPYKRTSDEKRSRPNIGIVPPDSRAIDTISARPTAIVAVYDPLYGAPVSEPTMVVFAAGLVICVPAVGIATPDPGWAKEVVKGYIGYKTEAW